MIKSRLVTFMLSLLPGAGHMYIGYMTKGIHLMSLFFGVIAIASILNMGIIGLLIPIICCYAIFDSLNLCTKLRSSGNNPITDDYLFKNLTFDNRKLVKYIAYGAIILGILSLFSNMLPIFTDYLEQILGREIFTYEFYKNVRNFVVAIALIIGGIVLLKGRKFKGE